jgi:hypothetical protein
MSTHKELASLGQGSPGGTGALGLGLMRRPGAKQYNASPANPKVIAAYLREAFESGDPRLHVSDFFVLALGGFEEAEEGKRSSNSPEVA